MSIFFDNLKSAHLSWRTKPLQTAQKIGQSAYGQLFFWTVGQDFIGVGMDKKWGPGFGHVLARRITRHLPQTVQAAWIIKFIEIASDATKMPIEGLLYQRDGVVPDAVSAAATQPLFSAVEVIEKIIGIIRHPERVHNQNQVEDSVSSIYGTWTRNGLSWLQWNFPEQMGVSKPATKR